MVGRPIIQGVELKLSPCLFHTGAKGRPSIRIFSTADRVYTKYTSFETRTRRLMDVYEELEDIQFTQVERKCAHMMMILVKNNINNNSNIMTREIKKKHDAYRKRWEESIHPLEKSSNLLGF